MTLSNMIVRETTENEFVIGMLLTSGSAEPVQAAFDHNTLRKVAVDLPEESISKSDSGLTVRVRCFLPN